ncbi:hypothetical protein ABZ801_25395 [Actinomadura sp. NPDC047616]|uniref:M16 family metallopeptidase n=1 Tax=Actinomadura sp. NPDC047616 TaxID=3155914 RepID=UPI0033EE278E
MKVTRTEIDGVPAFWASGGYTDGYRVALLFRVGQSDETLARSGITHLVEHLALHRVGQPEHHYNGTVDSVTTAFFTEGDGDEVIRFLATVCGALREPPLDRLEAEKQILRTEAAGRSPGAAGRLLLWRYGAAGYGLQGYDELGLPAHTGEDVTAWTARWFTRANAALAVVGGPPPAGLRLDLPDGERMPPPEPTSALPHTPAYFNSQVNGVGLSAIVPRATAGNVFATILQRRLHKALRLDDALSYSAQVGYSPRDRDVAHIVAFADGLAESHPRLTQEFIDEIERIADEPVADAELGEAVSIHRARLDQPETAGAMTMSSCWNELMGAPHRTYEEILRHLDELTPDDVQDVGRTVRDSALLMVPDGQEPHVERYVPAPGSSVVAVRGETFTRADPEAGHLHLIVGPTGVTSMAGPTMGTVRYDSCAAVLAWPDGARALIGLDGITVHIEPNRWIDADGLPARIDRMVPADRVVPMPARPDEDIPERPETTVAPPKPGRRRRSLRSRVSFGLREGTAWDDPALAAALPQVGAGRLDAGLELLTRSRSLPELRGLYLDRLSRAASGHSDRLAAMAAARPDDPDVHLWLGGTLVREAWDARGSAQSEYVSDEQFAQFWLILAGAGEPLYRAAELLPEDPVPWDSLQWHAIGLQLGRLELDRIWRELKDRHDGLYCGHYTRAQALCAKWWGSDADVLEFAESTVEAAKPGDPLAAILPVALLENGMDADDGLEAYLSRPETHAALGAAADKWLTNMTEHPRTREAHHLFGAAFYFAGDVDRARHHLSQAGKTLPDGLPWGYWARPARAYKDALRDLGLR